VDKYLNMELNMNVGTSDEQCGRVIKRAWGEDGRAVGQSHTNPLFDAREYDIEFNDGSIERYMANIIAENMLARGTHIPDNEGNCRPQEGRNCSANHRRNNDKSQWKQST
jgi:hypothetical protein